MRPWYRNLDWVSLGLWLALAGIGLVAIYSATHGPAREFLLDSVQNNFNRQAQWFVISTVVLAVTLFLPAQFIVRMWPLVYAVCLLLLISALLFGTEINGAKSWLRIAGFSLQVAEVAKIGVVLAATAFLARKESRVAQFGFNLAFLRTVGILVGIILVPAVLVVAQNDTGTGLVFLSLIPVMLYWSGLVPIAWMAVLGAVGVSAYLSIINPVFATLFVGIATLAMFLLSRSKGMAAIMLLATGAMAVLVNVALFRILEPHQVGRIIAFNDPEAYRSTVGFHVIQSKAAIGSGGLFGKGFTEGTQTQLNYIPENSTDFVYTIIGEEFGFIGTTLVLVLFGALIIRLAGLGVQAGFALPRLFIAGTTGIFLVHILINVGMTIGLMPIIGIPLPFISYGGSALLANTTMLAIALNLHARRDEFAVYQAE